MKEFQELNNVRERYGNLSFYGAILMFILLIPIVAFEFGFKLGWRFSELVLNKLNL
jgi:hypothetical protein